MLIMSEFILCLYDAPGIENKFGGKRWCYCKPNLGAGSIYTYSQSAPHTPNASTTHCHYAHPARLLECSSSHYATAVLFTLLLGRFFF